MLFAYITKKDESILWPAPRNAKKRVSDDVQISMLQMLISNREFAVHRSDRFCGFGFGHPTATCGFFLFDLLGILNWLVIGSKEACEFLYPQIISNEKDVSLAAM